jgi:hypothetical protein
VAFYVPLGLRGILFRIGTFIIGIWGGLVYGLAYRRRTVILNHTGYVPSISLEARAYADAPEAPTLPELLIPRLILGESETAAAA